MLTLRSISLLTALAAFAPLAGQDGVKLRWKFESGDVLRYRMTTEQLTDLSSMGGQTMETSTAFVMRELVQEVAADGTASVEIGYEAMRVTMDMGTLTQFDSTLSGEEAKKNDASLGKLVAPILAGKLHMKVDPSGRISGLTGVKEMLANAASSGDAAGKMLERTFSEDAQRKWLEVNVFPDKALNPGDTWNHDFDVAAPPSGKMKFAVANKLESLEDRAGASCARISAVTKLTLEFDETAAYQMHIVEDETKSEGTMWFDPKRGRMVESAQSLRMKMGIGPATEGTAEGEAQMQVSVSTTTKLLLLSTDAPAFEPKKK
ncbi:MAG TPA: DUF6263 family protein [Planctomycetota bacterium]|nr:DUF6263 family protein [Planctomycetota bacterium]